jgi:hypothetical protein
MRTLLLVALASSTAYADPPRRIMLATDPLALVNGTYTADAAYAIHDHVALTGEALYADPGDVVPAWRQSRVQAGVRLFLDRAFQGPFVEAGLRRTHVSGDGTAVDQNGAPIPFHAEYRTFGPTVSVGWQWTFHDTWSIAYAIGTSKAWSVSGNVLGVAGGTEHDLRVGFVF